MLAKGEISQDEKEAILSFLGSSESLSTEILEAAASLAENEDQVLYELKKTEQTGAYKPDYPEPTTHISEPAPKAQYGSDMEQDIRSLTEEEMVKRLQNILPGGE